MSSIKPPTARKTRRQTQAEAVSNQETSNSRIQPLPKADPPRKNPKPDLRKNAPEKPSAVTKKKAEAQTESKRQTRQDSLFKAPKPALQPPVKPAQKRPRPAPEIQKPKVVEVVEVSMPDPEPMVVEEEKEEEVEISMPIEETKEEQLPLIGTETNVLMTLAATVDEGSVAQSIDDGLPADFYLQRKRELKGSYKAKFALEKLIIEYERKKVQVQLLRDKQAKIQVELAELREQAGETKYAIEAEEQTKKLEPVKKEKQDLGQSTKKSHHQYLIKELLWMQEDFERERKKKQGDAKKQIRMCRKELSERLIKKEKWEKDQRAELKRKANNMSKMVQLFWRSVEKITKHNFSVSYDKKRQQARAKKLENFVQKHLKLSVKVAEQLNTKSFVEQSMYDKSKPVNEDEQLKATVPLTEVKIYQSQDDFEEKKSGAAADEDDAQITNLAEQTVKMAEAFQPKGITLDSAGVATKVPFLLRNELREYQIIGLDWLVTLHNKRLNGILADEMGLGKTIQTISLLASLACDRGVWGPHLIVVPTTIIINWEMEFKRWCPALKILTYFGSQKERKLKRQGWSKENSFHVCITSYKLVIQDHFAFRRKKWYYMVLDEAQNIKNFKSQRWQTLLRFNTKRRLLLTGTPLQNDVMELWSLMHFLMPQIFSNQQDFKEWFSNPFSQSINQNQSLNIGVVQKLQSILRPFLLRRMKRDVEKQLPEKVEHIVQCNLSRRQRLLYDEYINNDKTKNTLADSDFFSIMNVLMQLRKVCNHPDLFESRTIESPFIMTDRMTFSCPGLIQKSLIFNDVDMRPLDCFDLRNFNMYLPALESLSTLHQSANEALFPHKSLAQAFRENMQSDTDLVSGQLMTRRPAVDGVAVSQKLYTNCNVLNASNTHNLELTVPKIMPSAPAQAGFQGRSITNNSEHDFMHVHPNYLNVACLPFAQQFYSLGSFDNLRYPQLKNIKPQSTTTASEDDDQKPFDGYHSALSAQEDRDRKLAQGKKLITYFHYDMLNRMRLLGMRPVYGLNLRQAVKISLVLSADLYESKKHQYVDRKSKFSQLSIDECFSIPSAVFNPVALGQRNFHQDNHEDYLMPGCRVNDFTDSKYQGEDVIIDSGRAITVCQDLIQDVTLTWKGGAKYRESEQQLRPSQQTEAGDDFKPTPPKPDTEDVIMVEGAEAVEEINHQNICEEDQLVIEINVKDLAIEPEGKNGENSQNPNVRILRKRKDEEPLQVLPILDDNEAQNEDQQQQAESLKNEEGNKEQPADQSFSQGEQGVQEGDGGQKSDEDKINEAQEVSKENQPEQAAEVEEKQNDELEQKEPDVQSPEKLVQAARESSLSYQIGYRNSDTLRELVTTPLQRGAILDDLIKHFKCIIPKVVSKPPEFVATKIDTRYEKNRAYERFAYQKLMSHRNVNQSLKFSNILFFPHKNLIQYDCGKLQRLAQLLKTLYVKGSKVLIFTQMTRMLDILETFLNLHGYTYVRLDGSVGVEARQKMVDRFNLDPKIFCFISSTRCGGIGINLTGADCVVFYDTDWNPSMDKQAQDRSHRIGQTKTVHIYRLISINTIEENIFKKSLQKRELGGLIIEGNFNTEMYAKIGMRDILETSYDDLLKPKARNLLDEENIVFHHLDHAASAFATQQNQSEQKEIQTNGEANNEYAEMARQAELEAYRRQFEEAMIRIEDEEDVEAFKEAKAEIDDEFDEIEGRSGNTTTYNVDQKAQSKTNEGEAEEEEPMALDEAPAQPLVEVDQEATAKAPHGAEEIQYEFEMLGQSKPGEEKSPAQIAKEQALAEQRRTQEEFDKKNAAGAAKELKKSEMVDWINHPMLNKVTKMAIGYFETSYNYDDYLVERSEKEGKLKSAKQSGQDGKDKSRSKEGSQEDLSGSEDEEEDEEDAMGGTWDRAEAERMYLQTREILQQLYAQQYELDEI